jgi:hypothetical protein
MSCSDCPPPLQTQYNLAKKQAQKLANESGQTYYIDINNAIGIYTSFTAFVKEIVMPDSTA